MKPKTRIKSLALLGLTLLMAACSPTTEITRSWYDPSVTAGTLKPFTKVLIIARLKDVTSQRIAEDKIATQFKQGVAVPSYGYLTPGDTVESAVDARLRKDGFDGIVTMKLTNVSKSLDVQNYGGSGYGYYGRGYGYGSSTVTVDHTYFVESCVYALPGNKLIWSGTTSTLEPSDLNKTLDDIINACKADMIAKGIIKQ